MYWVYILASRRNGTLYTGVTSDLTGRVQAHREGLIPGFTKKYGVKLLVYYELHHDINVAILREKTHQALASQMEAGADRSAEPAVARSVAGVD